ncbi:OPT oligopeptide transporter protein-domain-containing protein [Zopfochytrium polystomum]|nr:OPT oligopeptide transporter protein-domain-containing protein [Zopfochytrium polystomum]
MSADPQLVTEAELELAVERKLEHEKAGDIDPEAGDYIDEIYDIVDAVVSRTDDPTLPALTIRVWILGVFFGFLLALVNTLFTFRTNTITLNPFIAVLLAYPIGIAMGNVFPKVTVLGVSLNPGKFNFKEHALIYVFASTCSGPAYALYNIIGQRYQLYQEDLSVVACVFFGIVTQCFGYGLAGLCRRYLVRPAAMLWPSNLSTIALLNSLHQEDVDPALPLSRFSYFWIITGVIFVWEWIPGLIAPLITAISILCYVAPKTGDRGQMMRLLGSGYNGMGMLSFSFDWSLISYLAPITTPLWALVNQVLGLWVFLWVLTPILWVHNAFGIDFSLGAAPVDGPNGSGLFPLGQALNTAALFTKDGIRISARSFVNKADLSLNDEVYNESQPIYITTYFALLTFGTASARRCATLDTADVHAKMMDVYPEVPDLWYIILLVANIITAIGVCQWGGFQLPWWGVLLGFLLALVSMIPIGTIQAISGQQIGLNVMSEFLIGLILPGRIAAVMAFKTFSYMAMAQGLLLVSDLKLGHYIKIPPRAMFTVQLFSTIMAVIRQHLHLLLYLRALWQGHRDFRRCRADHLGAAGPRAPYRLERQRLQRLPERRRHLGRHRPRALLRPGPGSPYVSTLWGFLIGAVLPVVPWVMHRFFPDGYWHLVNIPVIMTVPLDPGSILSIMITPLLVGILVNYVVKKYHHAWWKKYAYVTSAALDCGTAIALTVIFFIFVFNENAPKLPRYALNRYDPELCAPDYYQTCNERYDDPNYDPTTDPECMYFGSAS